MRNHYGFFYKDNFQYWVSRIIPGAVVNPLPILLGYFLTTFATNKEKPFTMESFVPGIGLYLTVVVAITILLYLVFRFMDKKEYIKDTLATN